MYFPGHFSLAYRVGEIPSELGILGNYRKWEAKRRIQIDLQLTEGDLFRLMRYANSQGYNSYESLVLALLQQVTNPDLDRFRQMSQKHILDLERTREKLNKELTETIRIFKLNQPRI